MKKLLLIGNILISSLSFSQAFNDIISTSNLNTSQGVVAEIFDYNGDLLEDIIYVNQPQFGGTYTLQLNNGDGTFSDITSSSSFPDSIPGNLQIQAVDLDNDGDFDIVNTNGPNIYIYINDNGQFVDGNSTYSINNPILPYGIGTWKITDINKDSFTDLIYKTNNGGTFQIRALLTQFYGCYGEIQDTMLISLDANGYNFILSDLNNDQELDIILGRTQSYTQHQLYVYQNQSNLVFSQNGTGLPTNNNTQLGALIDINNDLNLDFFSGTDDCCGTVENVVVINNGNFSFTDATTTYNIFSGNGYYTNPTSVDFDNDQDQDIYFGGTTTICKLFRNDGGTTFPQVAGTYNLNKQPAVSAGGNPAPQWFDIENDGDLDLFIANRNLINTSGISWLMQNPLDTASNRSIQVKLKGCSSSSDAYGSMVTIYHAGNSQRKIKLNSVNSAYPGSDYVHFGLGNTTTFDSIIVNWTSGAQTVVYNIVSNQVLTIEEDSNCTLSNYNSSSTINEIACDSYTSPSGNYTWTTSNTYYDTLTNIYSCDSVITVNLTINNSNTGTDIITACDSYSWIDGNTYTSSNNSATWTLTNTAGCDSVVTLDLTINPLPDNNVTQTGAVLTAEITGASYQWLDCDDNYSIINGETNQSYTPTPVTGNYAVEITLNGCVDTSSCYHVDYTGLSEMYKDILSINPNPATDVLNINGLNAVLGLASLTITSSNGELVFEANEVTESIDVSRYPTGVYFLNITHEAGIETIRFVKE